MITRLVSVPRHSDSVISVLNFVKLNKSCKQHYSFVIIKLKITDKKYTFQGSTILVYFCFKINYKNNKHALNYLFLNNNRNYFIINAFLHNYQ